MSNDDRREPFDFDSDEDFVRDLLGSLEGDRPAPPETLDDQTIRKVQAELTSRDLIDLTTFVFLMRFCAPLLDLLAAFFGHDPLSPPQSMGAPRTRTHDRSDPDE
ncbi:MAG: hypothetical protein NXI30_13525 [bacterium]|nr:hypothetical protein [bacterium]